jgi:hypothetical protein
MDREIKESLVRSVFKMLEKDSAISIRIYDKDLGDGEYEAYVRIENEAAGRPVPIGGRPYTIWGEIPLSSWNRLLEEFRQIEDRFIKLTKQ